MADLAARDAARALAGLQVLVTRPRHQSAPLAALIDAHGGTAIRFPVVDIVAPQDSRAARAAMAKLDDYSLVIFVSPNAVEHGLALMNTPPTRARMVAVGESSASALEQAGLGPVLRPAEGASSEALLALPELGEDAVAGSRVLIVRGEGGRQLLGGTLCKRGARVTYAEVYRRALPEVDVSGIAERGRAGEIDTVIVTSLQGLDNLFDMLGDGDTAWLRETGYVVISERLATHARALGIKEPPVVAARADDDALVEALIRWRKAHPNDRK